MSILERFCEYFSIDEEGYKKLIAPLSFSSIPTIENDPMVIKTIGRLKEAKEKGEKVLIYGDYDCDGVMSTSILLRALREFGVIAEGYLPSRYLDGYGINEGNVEKIAAKGYDIIFTTDNGVTAHSALKKAKEKGITTVVLDHHEFDKTAPETDYLLHPSKLAYGNVPISAGFLAFLFSHSLLNRFDPYLLTLGAVSTLSDSMPLRDENRAIVRLALEILNEKKYPEFVLLTDATEFDETTLQFDVIPKINAVGRLEKEHQINRLLPYFSRSSMKMEAIANYLNQTNEKRKSMTKEIVSSLSIDENEPALSLSLDAPEGMNGLLSSRLLSLYQKPVAVFSQKESDKECLVGSIRSVPGFDIGDALSKMDVAFVARGGHALAGGCTIKKEDFAHFKKEFSFFALKAKLSKPSEKTIPLERDEANIDTYRIYRSFAPYGEGWKAPKFSLKGLDPNAFTFMKDGKYLNSQYGACRLLSFSLGKESFDYDKNVDLVGSIREHNFKGKKNLEILVEKAL